MDRRMDCGESLCISRRFLEDDHQSNSEEGRKANITWYLPVRLTSDLDPRHGTHDYRVFRRKALESGGCAMGVCVCGYVVFEGEGERVPLQSHALSHAAMVSV